MLLESNHIYLPHSNIRVGRAGHHLIVSAAAVETPHLVLMRVQRLYALIGLDGPQLHQTVRTTEDTV